MSYYNLTLSERLRIEIYLEEGYSISAIARKLERNKSTISREIKRCESTNYSAELAQRDYEEKSSYKGSSTKASPELVELIEDKLKESWSPEQIVGRLLQKKLSFKTIYRWIYNHTLSVGLQYLRQKGKRRFPAETRGKFRLGSPISKRPRAAKKRQELGHWEADTMVSSRGKSKGCFATFADRKSRLYIAFKMEDRTAKSMEEAVKKLQSMLGINQVKTITTDRGKEFACYEKLEEATPTRFYFADPYSAWQRGTNENSNGLLREFFPKKTDLLKVEEDDLHEALRKINNRPRKCLGWKTPLEVFCEGLLHLI